MMSKALVANFQSPHDLIRVARQIHKSGIKKFDILTPYPIHGLDEAMGIQSSPIPWFSLILGLTGAALGMTFQWWTSVVSYPLVIGGKPFFSWPAFIPVTFECGILICAFATFFALFRMCKLPKFESPFETDSDALRTTNDQFLIYIDSSDTRFDESRLRDILSKHRAEKVRWTK